MSSLGLYLRELRQQRGVSLEELARVTRVAARYLEALETDEFSALPAPVFTKGFIRAYCQALREPPDEALARYPSPPEEPVVAPPRPGPLTRSKQTEERRGRGTILVSFVLLVVLGLGLFAVTLTRDSGRDGAAPRTEDGVAPPLPPASGNVAVATDREAPPTPARALEPPARQPETSPKPAVATPVVPPPPGTTRLYRLVARTTETTWVRVQTQDGRSVEETIPPGQTRQWISDRPFILTVGNAGGLSLELNGQALPSLGPSGAVIPRLVIPSDSP